MLILHRVYFLQKAEELSTVYSPVANETNTRTRNSACLIVIGKISFVNYYVNRKGYHAGPEPVT